jgi:MFS family permease
MKTKNIRLGLRENWKQFTLLVVINAFVGGMVGMERSILPKIADAEFHIAARTAILSFIIVFGIVKAITNYFTGTLANKFGRKNLLVIGWLIGIPVPFILMYAPDWNWIVAANILLGMNQGLTWSSTVMMKIDLVGERQRGFAMGLNEFAGYIAVAAMAFFTGWIAGQYGLRPYPFYIGVFIAVIGFLSSLFLVRDTILHVEQEAVSSHISQLKNIFWETSWKNKNLGSVTQAGLVNNLNDGMVWGIFPILLASRGFTIAQIGIVAAIYPAVWGVGQVLTGKMADRFCKKNMLFGGMTLQSVALVAFILATTFIHFIFLSILLGWGTALVYPTFLAAIAENTHPQDRARSLGIFRFWRDLGYAIGAIITGIIADAIGMNASILFIGILTFISGLIIYYRMKCAGNNLIKIKYWLRNKFMRQKAIHSYRQ